MFLLPMLHCVKTPPAGRRRAVPVAVSVCHCCWVFACAAALPVGVLPISGGWVCKHHTTRVRGCASASGVYLVTVLGPCLAPDVHAMPPLTAAGCRLRSRGGWPGKTPRWAGPRSAHAGMLHAGRGNARATASPGTGQTAHAAAARLSFLYAHTARLSFIMCPSALHSVCVRAGHHRLRLPRAPHLHLFLQQLTQQPHGSSLLLCPCRTSSPAALTCAAPSSSPTLSTWAAPSTATSRASSGGLLFADQG